MRVKLFKFVEASKAARVDAAENGMGAAVGGVVASVPPANHIGSPTKGKEEDGKNGAECKTADASSCVADGKDTKTKMDWKEVGIGPLRILEQTGEEETKNGDDKDKTIDAADSTDNKTTTATTEKKYSVRLVQRRESTPGGQGTKLILNLPLRSECHVLRKGDKFVRLSAFEALTTAEEEGKGLVPVVVGNDKKDTEEGTKKKEAISFQVVQYLFKVKTVVDADSLEKALQKGIANCAKE